MTEDDEENKTHYHQNFIVGQDNGRANISNFLFLDKRASISNFHFI